MSKTDQGQEVRLQLRRVFTAPRERVFRAWTDPEELKSWFGPSDEFTVPIVEVDLKVGGKYRIELKTPKGELYVVVGTYQEVRAPEKLVYTWSWEQGETRDTLVTVEFRDLGGSTEVSVTHERFPNEEARGMHEQGWTGCLGRLGKLVGEKT